MISLLDYSACVVSVTCADKDIDIKNDGSVPNCEADEKSQDGYDPETYHGAPVAVQVVSRRLEEENVLEYTTILDDALKAVESSKLPN